MLLLAGLGLDPWDVLHQGLSRRIGLGVGTWAIIVGVAVLLAWIPLRQRPGIGTLCNVLVVGAVIDLMLAVAHPPHALVEPHHAAGRWRRAQRRGDRRLHRRGPGCRARGTG